MLTPAFCPICLDHMPDAKTIYSHSITWPFTFTPEIFPFLVKISSTGDFSKIFAPYIFAAFANMWVTPEGSAAPSPGIKIPPMMSSVSIIG